MAKSEEGARREALARKCAAVHYPHEASCDIVMCKAQFERCVAAILSYAKQAGPQLIEQCAKIAFEADTNYEAEDKILALGRSLWPAPPQEKA